MKQGQDIIYFDNNATTKVLPSVLEAMIPFLSESYANPASEHRFGRSVKSKVDFSRQVIAEFLGVDHNDLIFTSGATESLNLAIKGYALKNIHKGRHIITCQTEHNAVLDTCSFLETVGFEISYLPVENDGSLRSNDLQNSIRPDTILCTLMYANNETGVIHPIPEIGRMIKDKNIAFITDATQVIGKLPIDLGELEVDALAFSGHKFHGPKGIGVLYVKNRAVNGHNFQPLTHGGGQEFNLRSGTLNVPGIIGLASACINAQQEMATRDADVKMLRDELESSLLRIDGAYVNGAEPRLFNTSNICFPGVDANAIIADLKNICISNGSACTSAIVEPSHVLTAMGRSRSDAFSSLRFSLSSLNSRDEVARVIEALNKTILKLSIVP